MKKKILTAIVLLASSTVFAAPSNDNLQQEIVELQAQVKQVQQENQTNITAVQNQMKQMQTSMQAEIDKLQKEIQDLTNKVH